MEIILKKYGENNLADKNVCKAFHKRNIFVHYVLHDFTTLIIGAGEVGWGQRWGCKEDWYRKSKLCIIILFTTAIKVVS